MLNLTEGWEDELAHMDPPAWIVKTAWALWMAFIVAMVLGAFVVSKSAMAADSWKGQGDDGQVVALVLFDTPCSDPAVLKHALQQVKDELIPQLKDARLLWRGKEWASCWIEIRGTVYSIDEEGSMLQPIPRRMFGDNTI